MPGRLHDYKLFDSLDINMKWNVQWYHLFSEPEHCGGDFVTGQCAVRPFEFCKAASRSFWDGKKGTSVNAPDGADGADEAGPEPCVPIEDEIHEASETDTESELGSVHGFEATFVSKHTISICTHTWHV